MPSVLESPLSIIKSLGHRYFWASPTSQNQFRAQGLQSEEADDVRIYVWRYEVYTLISPSADVKTFTLEGDHFVKYKQGLVGSQDVLIFFPRA